MASAAGATQSSGFVDSVKECTSKGFASIKENGSKFATWLSKTVSDVATKVKDFVMNTVWPKIQQFGAKIKELAGKAKDCLFKSSDTASDEVKNAADSVKEATKKVTK